MYKGVIKPIALEELPKKDTYTKKELKDTNYYIASFDVDDEEHEVLIDSPGYQFFSKIKEKYNWY